jgi:hypothetical protein
MFSAQLIGFYCSPFLDEYFHFISHIRITRRADYSASQNERKHRWFSKCISRLPRLPRKKLLHRKCLAIACELSIAFLGLGVDLYARWFSALDYTQAPPLH